MSHTAIETALFDIVASPVQVATYKNDPAQFLDRYELSNEERVEIINLDVRKILLRGCSPMLTMRAFNAIKGRDQLPEYLRRIRERQDG